MSSLIDYAEETSHILLGYEQGTPLERVAAHAVGYAFSPIRYGMDYAINKLSSAYAKPEDHWYRDSKRHGLQVNMNRRREQVARRGARESRPTTKPGSPTMPPPKKKTQKRRTRKSRTQKPAKPIYPRRFRAPGRGMPRRPRRGGGVSVGRQSTMFERKVAPPASEGWIMNSGSAATFFPVKDPGCSGLRVSCKMGNMGNNTTGTTAITLTGTTVGGAIPVAPQYSVYNVPAVTDYCQLFERYQVTRHRMFYVPSCASTTAGMVGVVYFDDPRNVYIVAGISGDSEAIEATNLVASRSDLKEGPLYGNRLFTKWYTPIKGQDMRYINGINNSIDSSIGWSASDVATLRDQIQGGYVWYNTNSTPNLSFGDVFIEMDIVLCGLQGVSITAPTVLQHKTYLQRQCVQDNLHLLLPLLEELKKEKDEDKAQDQKEPEEPTTRIHRRSILKKDRQPRRSRSIELTPRPEVPTPPGLFKM